MKNFEKNIKVVLNKISTTSDGVLYSSDIELSMFELRDLSAKGLIELIPAGDNEFFLTLGEYGYSYFDVKAEKRADFIKNFFSNFFAGFFVRSLCHSAG